MFLKHTEMTKFFEYAGEGFLFITSMACILFIVLVLITISPLLIPFAIVGYLIKK